MNEEHVWVDWFKELATKIASEDESFLIEKSKRINWVKNRALVEFGDKNIDPFSFFYFLAGKIRHISSDQCMAAYMMNLNYLEIN